MDEIEFARAMNNLKALTDHIQDTNTVNALKVVTHLLAALNDRVTEMQMEEDDDE